MGQGGSVGYLSADDLRAIFLDPAGALFRPDRHADDTFATAAPLEPTGAYGAGAPDRITASLGDPTDVDVYKVEAPDVGAPGRPLVMTVTGRATEVSGIMPRVAVFAADLRPVPSLILAHGDGTFTIQVVGARPEAAYYLRVDADPAAGKVVGNDELDVEYGRESPIARNPAGPRPIRRSARAGAAGQAQAGPPSTRPVAPRGGAIAGAPRSAGPRARPGGGGPGRGGRRDRSDPGPRPPRGLRDRRRPHPAAASRVRR